MKIGIFKKTNGFYNKCSINLENYNNVYYCVYDNTNINNVDSLEECQVIGSFPIPKEDTRVFPYVKAYLEFKEYDTEKTVKMYYLITHQKLSYKTVVFLKNHNIHIDAQWIMDLNELENSFFENLLSYSFFLEQIFRKDKKNSLYEKIVHDYLTNCLSKKDSRVNITLKLRVSYLIELYANNEINLSKLHNWLDHGGFINDIKSYSKVKFYILTFINNEKNSNLSDILENFIFHVSDSILISLPKEVAVKIVTDNNILEILKNSSIKEKYIFYTIINSFGNIEKYLSSSDVIKYEKIKRLFTYLLIDTINNPNVFRCYGYKIFPCVDNFISKDVLICFLKYINKKELSTPKILLSLSLFNSVHSRLTNDLAGKTIRRLLIYYFNHTTVINGIVLISFKNYISCNDVKGDLIFEQLIISMVKGYYPRKHKRISRIITRSLNEVIILYLSKLDKNTSFKFIIKNNFFPNEPDIYSYIINPIKYLKKLLLYYINNNLPFDKNFIYLTQGFIMKFKIDYNKALSIFEKYNIPYKLSSIILSETSNPLTNPLTNDFDIF